MSISSRKKWTAAVAGVLVLATAGMASAQGSKEAEAAIKYRQAVYTVIFNNFGPMGAMASDKMPFDAARFRRHAGRVASVAAIAPDTFPEISKDGNTRAKPEIWTNKAEFDQMMADFLNKAAALATVSRTAASVDDVKAAFGAAAGTCKTCHDKFRVD
ncbi:MAG: cytochrome c [Steroidobacteraceae bacterium]|nr:cytochrome c [Nevskiaceae bacterium]MCP5340023.1 cytochrome c [Nevskiaceae bacterium]MCP5359247.1 cytochrome c [Nevskiaceae bacterium]MCP5466480.1 cytochrome c [Nevskiaceae bacterium]MCP5471817.1 cytochrome c [Nevskiaceae bacterium]